MFNRKQYMKQYYQEHKQKLDQINNEWKKNHPEYLKKYYQENKQRILQQNKKWQKENPKVFSQLCQKSRRRRVERLKEQGCTNSWCVVVRGDKPKYKNQGENNG